MENTAMQNQILEGRGDGGQSGWACRRRDVGSVVGMGMSAARCGRCGGHGRVGGEVWEV